MRDRRYYIDRPNPVPFFKNRTEERRSVEFGRIDVKEIVRLQFGDHDLPGWRDVEFRWQIMSKVLHESILRHCNDSELIARKMRRGIDRLLFVEMSEVFESVA